MYGYILKDRLAKARDLNELALCATRLEPSRHQIDSQLVASGWKRGLQGLINERRARLSDPAKAEAGLNHWVRDAPEKERTGREIARHRILQNLTDRRPDLHLSGLHLTTLPGEIAALCHLQTLNLDINLLDHLPVSIGLLTKLTQLSANGNRLRRLPESIGFLRELKHLDLAYNRLERLPKQLGFLTELTSLDIRENPRLRLPAEIHSLPRLKCLRLANFYSQTD